MQSRDYRPALAVYTIVVLTSGDQYARDMLMIDFDPKDRHGLGMGEIPHKIIYLCPKYLNEETPEAWREWMQAINDSLDGEVDTATYHNEKVQKVLEIIRKDTVTPEERARMKDEYSEEALLKEEREKGLRQGEQQKALDIAAQLLDLLDDATIAQKTGLSIAAVVSLRQG